jgi:hypothetical protein
MYATYTDSPDRPEDSEITNILYTSIPSYTTSDHVRVQPFTDSLSLEILTDHLSHCTETSCGSSSPTPFVPVIDVSPSPRTTSSSYHSTADILHPSSVSLRHPCTLHRARPRPYPRLNTLLTDAHWCGIGRLWNRKLFRRAWRVDLVADDGTGYSTICLRMNTVVGDGG